MEEGVSEEEEISGEGGESPNPEEGSGGEKKNLLHDLFGGDEEEDDQPPESPAQGTQDSPPQPRSQSSSQKETSQQRRGGPSRRTSSPDDLSEERGDDENATQVSGEDKYSATFDDPRAEDGTADGLNDENELHLEEMPFGRPAEGSSLHFFKLAALAIEPRPFEKETFAIEDDDPDDPTVTTTKKQKKKTAPTTVRWRYALDKNQEMIRQSNARFVKWSDGSMHLFVGKEAFGVSFDDFKDYHDLFIRHRKDISSDSFLQCHGILEKKITLNPIDNVDRLKKEALKKMNSAKALETKRERPHFISATSDPEKEKKQKEQMEAKRNELQKKYGKDYSHNELSKEMLEDGAGEAYDEEKEKVSEARIMAAKRGNNEYSDDEDYNNSEEEQHQPKKSRR